MKTRCRMIALLLCLALALAGLAGCGGPPAGEGEPAEGDALATATEIPLGDEGPPTGKILTVAKGRNGWSIDAEAGYYDTFMWYSGSSNILYTDYATATQKVLCSAEGCAHQDASCTGWRNNIIHMSMVEDELLLVTGGFYQGEEDEYVPVAVELCQPDGSGSRVLASFGQDEYFGGPVLYDEDKLYFLMNQQLMSLDRQSGELGAVHSFAGEEHHVFLLGAREDKFLFQRNEDHTNYDAVTEETTEEEYDALLDERGSYFTLANLPDAEEELVYGWKFNQNTSFMEKDDIRYYTTEAGEVKADNIYTGETRTLCAIPAGSLGPVYLDGICDGRLILSGSAEENGVYFSKAWAVQLETGELTELSLTMESKRVSGPLEPLNYGGSPDAIIPLAEAGDSFLVNHRTDFYKTRYGGMLGEADAYEVDVEIRRYALISKADFWAGKANYTLVDSTERNQILARDVAFVSV